MNRYVREREAGGRLSSVQGGTPPGRHETSIGRLLRGEQRVAANPQQEGAMTCTHCGTDTMTMSYTLRCTPGEGDARIIDLRLCTDCLRSLCTEQDIELAEESRYVTA